MPHSSQLVLLTSSVSDQDSYKTKLQYQYSIQQTCDEKKGKYQLGDYLLTQYQILWTKLLKIVLQTARITVLKILGSKRVTEDK